MIRRSSTARADGERSGSKGIGYTDLAAANGKVLSREDLLEHVWGYDYFGDSRLVDVHIRRLRMKIEPDPASPTYLVTVRGTGYKLVI